MEFAPFGELQPCYFHVSAYPATRLTLADEVKAIDDGTIEDTGILDGSLILSAAEHPDLYARALAMQRTVNEALDIRHGPTHMEVFESASGTLTFSETAARMGGGWVPAIQSAYVGENVWKLTGRALTEGGIPSRSRPTGHIGALNLRPTHSGRIVAMPDEERLLAEDGVLDYVKIRNVGETISLRTGTYWCAYVVLRADTEEEFMERARHLLARHKVVTAAD
ncbi:MAG: hypothetical protein HOV70_30090 [Streptomyces sp.]|nr:hypothetical protein [Streptomyces sp.]NUS80433.1 hypothetical protein [Streptomyces sp.]